MSDFAGSGALVEASVVGVNGRDVEVGNDLIGTGVEVADLNPLETDGRDEMSRFRRRPTVVKYLGKKYLSEDEIFFPSNSQVISGNGFPDAEHLRLTLGPGCRVRSVNVDKNWGGSTVINDGRKNRSFESTSGSKTGKGGV